jgi:hypothetical protein
MHAELPAGVTVMFSEPGDQLLLGDEFQGFDLDAEGARRQVFYSRSP